MKWFKHDSDANLDAKLQNVLLDYGLEGYGLYWYCLELIAGKVTDENISFELEHDARIIAKNTGSTPQKVSEMMQYFVGQGLFEDDEGTITCLKLRCRLNKSMTSNPSLRKLIKDLKVETKDYSGYVYFITAKSDDQIKIKIGRSKNPSARINELRKRIDCTGLELELVHTIKSDDCVSLETEFHRKFNHLNIKDEWFEAKDDLLEFLKKDLRVDYELIKSAQIRLEKKRLEKNIILSDSAVAEITKPQRKVDNTPYREIVELYHEICDHMPRIEKLTAARKTQIRARHKNDLGGNLDRWEGFFIYVKNNCSWIGQPRDGGKRLNLDWLIKESNYIKIKERVYDDNRG